MTKAPNWDDLRFLLAIAQTTVSRRHPAILQAYDGFDGPCDDRIRYDTPAWHGLSAGGSGLASAA